MAATEARPWTMLELRDDRRHGATYRIDDSAVPRDITELLLNEKGWTATVAAAILTHRCSYAFVSSGGEWILADPLSVCSLHISYINQMWEGPQSYMLLAAYRDKIWNYATVVRSAAKHARRLMMLCSMYI